MPRRLSIIVPVFNEEKTVGRTIRRALGIKIRGLTNELIVINDGSTDQTASEIEKIKDRRMIVVNHTTNLGKGASVVTGLKKMRGDLGVIQDADLEYDPKDIKLLISPIILGKADVVYGSRFVGSSPHRVLYFWHRVANGLITWVCGVATNLNLTDVETGYKAFTKEVARTIELKEKRFGFDPEFTVKVAKMGFRIYEVGVSYAGRSYSEGKKIGWKDGIIAIWTIIRYSLFE